jgi:DNA-binding CsgD family transcriptional regulator
MIDLENRYSETQHSECGLLQADIRVAGRNDVHFAHEISFLIEQDASKPNAGLCKRTVSYISKKMEESKAVISLVEGNLAGFCYIESWGHGHFVANSGLIVKKKYRGMGLARSMKKMIFDLSREKFPQAKIFGLTTNLGVMKINNELGYQPVTYSELTSDVEYWRECARCMNFQVLVSSEYKNCLCTAFLYDPSKRKATCRNEEFQQKFSISKQEMKVFMLIIEGKRTSEISERLYISEDTVSSHRKRIIQKTRCKTPLEMYLLASKFQLIEL